MSLGSVYCAYKTRYSYSFSHHTSEPVWIIVTCSNPNHLILRDYTICKYICTDILTFELSVLVWVHFIN